MTSEPVRIDTYCPIFPGFYGTMFEGSEHAEADAIASVFSCAGVELSERALCDIANDSRCVDWDYSRYHRDYTERIVSAVSHELADLGVKLEFQTLASPREYNFRNDVGNVVAVIENPEAFRMGLLAFLLDHDDEFKAYIRKRFTSGPGFISFHDNDHSVWLEELRNWNPATDGYDSTRFGTLLEFYLLEEEEFDEWALFHTVEAPELLEYCSGPLLEAANDPHEDWLVACRQFDKYAEEKHATNFRAVLEQQKGHEEALVEMIRTWCNKRKAGKK